VIARRGGKVVFVEVKSKGGPGLGDPLEMVTAEKQRRLRRAATAWLAMRPELAGLETTFDVVAVREGRLERVRDALS
jgi:putative endonuclease